MVAARVLVSFLAASLAVAAVAAIPVPGAASVLPPLASQKEAKTQIRIEPHASDRALSPVLQGANVNNPFVSAAGLWDAEADAPKADPTAKMTQAGIGLLRFPGGSPANLYDWKRSIGPSDERICQTEGVSLANRVERGYGQDEYMELAHATGAEPEITVPFPNASPSDTADWLEYMDAPVGTNPNGGTAWADVRAANGAPEPYGVTRWEIGNEPYLAGQAFWTDPSDREHRLEQFIDGDEISFVDQPLGRNCIFDEPTTPTRTPGQRFFFLYRLIEEGTSPVVKVGGTPWTEVPDFSSAGPTDKVYVLDREVGAVVFGDGMHGAIPPLRQIVTASYTFSHEGFVAIYDALKATAAQIGLDIDVCAAWAPLAPRGTPLDMLGGPSFPKAMSSRGLGDSYDCVAAHPYTSLGTDFWPWATSEDAVHAHMVGDDWAFTMMSALDDDLETYSTNDAFIAITEMGALWFGTGPERDESIPQMPQFSATMTHATYMASQWMRYAPTDVGWVIGNDVVAAGLRTTLGGEATGFVYSAEAMTREALKPVFSSGSHWVPSHVNKPKMLTAPDGTTWPALVAGAARGADDVLSVVVVNRDPTSAQSVHLVPSGFPHDRHVQVATVHGASYLSFNDDGSFGGDNTVALTRTTLVTPDDEAFWYEVPPASVTVLALTPA